MNHARLSRGPKWEDLPLTKLLSDPYASALQRVYNHVEPLLRTRPLGAEEFTDHDLEHSARLVQRIGQILPGKGSELNQPELYILLLAALLHDSGMWTPREEAHDLLKDPEFRNYCDTHVEGELSEIENAICSERREWMGQLALQTLAASYNRVRHPERLGTFVLAEGSPTGGPLRTLIGADFIEAVIAVSLAHSWDHEELLENDTLRAREFGDQSELVELRFLAVLLRLGDLLDLGDGRVSMLLWAYLRPLNSVSESHWRKEAKLKVDRCEPNKIEISGRFDVDTGGIPEREAYRLACEWLEWLKSEIRNAHHYLKVMEPQFRNRIELRRLELDSSRVTAKGLADEGRVSFELNRDRIMHLLGEEIYSEGCIFVRELLQNAVDATRAQMVRDRKDEISAHDPSFPPSEPWDWPNEVTNGYQIEVDTGEEVVDQAEYKTFSIADPGIGMTLKQIRENFLQVGVSYYKTDGYKEEFAFPSISQFGIGFLSCLMVADRIEVVTRPHDEPAGIRLSIRSPSDQFLVENLEPHADADCGTSVSLWIATGRSQTRNWDAMPISDSKVVDVLEAPSGEAGNFSAAAKQWGAFFGVSRLRRRRKMGTSASRSTEGVPWECSRSRKHERHGVPRQSRLVRNQSGRWLLCRSHVAGFKRSLHQSWYV